MKYLLVGINAKYIHSNLAIYCLKNYAEKYTQKYSGKEIALKEYTTNMLTSEIVKGIYEEAPDFIGFSVYIWNVDMVMKVVKDIRILLPGVKIFLGGPEVSFDSEKKLLNYREADAIMVGEGEETFREIVEYYESISNDTQVENSSSLVTRSLYDIKGLCFRDDMTGEIIRTADRAPIDLSLLPFVYNDFSEFENRIIYYETSRGCPFGCAYCLSSVEKTVRFRNMELVQKELKCFLDAKVPQVKLVDRTFNIDHKRSLKLLEFLKENDNGITNFHFEIAGDILTDEEIDMINSLRPGLVQLEIGVQSTNEKTLSAINRRTDLNKLRVNTEKLLLGGKVHLHLDLIAGLPYEDLESFKKSFNDVYSMHSHELQLGFLKVLSGAPINNMVDEEKISYSPSSPYEVLSTKNLSYQDICELKAVEEMLEIYHNSCQFELSERFLLNREASAYDMYHGLARYYEEKNQATIQSKRMVKYELFLEYAKISHKLSDAETDELKSYLTRDYYSRENAKVRPSFAADIECYKDILREKYREIMSANNTNDKRAFYIEPLYGGKEYCVFDYTNRSLITGNAATKIYAF